MAILCFSLRTTVIRMTQILDKRLTKFKTAITGVLSTGTSAVMAGLPRTALIP